MMFIVFEMHKKVSYHILQHPTDMYFVYICYNK